MSFRAQLTSNPDGQGAEQFFASVSVDSERAYIESERYEFLLAEDGSDLAGFIAIRDKTHLFHLFVAHGFQRAGLARELWTRVRQPALRYTVNASLNAIPVYERLGFVAAGDRQHVHGVTFLPMQLEPRNDGARKSQKMMKRLNEVTITNQCTLLCDLRVWKHSDSQTWIALTGTQDEIGRQLAQALAEAFIQRLDDFGGVCESFLCRGDEYLSTPPRTAPGTAVFSFTPKKRVLAEEKHRRWHERLLRLGTC